jgi:hypothetical protein
MTRYPQAPLTCCPDCFAHPWLRDYVKERAKTTGNCPVCRRRKRPLLPVGALFGPFENLMTFYKSAEGSPLESGDPLIQLIQGDWELFDERIVESGKADILFESIMHSGWDDDGGPPTGPWEHYVRASDRWSHDTLADVWEEFSERVKKEPAHELLFRDATFHDFLINEDLLGRMTEHLPPATVLYRARLGFISGTDAVAHPHSGPNIGAPQAEMATAGRANRQNKVVLYCADQEQTAIAEVRPARGEYVSIAELCTRKELEILDLSADPESPNPFTDESLPYEVEFLELFHGFADALATPLRHRDNVVDYIPSQKLVELIEQAGADGIRYPSAMTPDGTNVVLFAPHSVDIGESRLIEITETSIKYQEVR